MVAEQDLSQDHENQRGAGYGFSQSSSNFINYPKFLLSAPKTSPFSNELLEKMSAQSSGSNNGDRSPSLARIPSAMSRNLAPIEEEKEPAQNQDDPASSRLAEVQPIYQAKDLDEFLKIAYDVKSISSFGLKETDRAYSFGAKVLVAGNDISLHNFVQEYCKRVLQFTKTKNTLLKRSMQVYLIPNGFNSLANFIATREPVYRQNVFQFFSRMNKAYNDFVKFNGELYDEKSIKYDPPHLKKLYENVIQHYLKEGIRPFDVKVFKAQVWHKGAASPKVIYFTNRLEIGSM